jgi:hypothetical protein
MNVILIIFNRPDTTRRVAEAIAKARPARLLVVADGPRVNYPEDRAKVEETRKVIDEIDWQCEVLRNYSDVNMTCRKRIVTGLDWAFSIVEEAIILEDDTLPDQSFFPFCAELLERYRHNEEVAYIGGYQFFPDSSCVPDSYYFSIYGSIWGWATWRRAWQLNDDAMKDWPELKKSGWVNRIFPEEHISEFFEKTWDKMWEGFDTWDYRWYFAIRRHNMLSVVPSFSMIENIGFGGSATHTTSQPPEYQLRKAKQMVFPLRHPGGVSSNTAADKILSDAAYFVPPVRWVQSIGRLGNRHFYGMIIRRIPWVGKIWARVLRSL